jgi:hypothetical protein
MHIDAHVLVDPEHLGGAQHHAGGEEVPLDFEPRIRAVVDRVTDHGIGGADEAGR